MRVLSATLCYPAADAPEEGIFVQRRLVALARRYPVDVRVVAPRLRCPLLRSRRPQDPVGEPLKACYPSMPSVPLLGRLTDGMAFARCLQRAILAGGEWRPDLLDAHFEYPDGVGAWLAGRRMRIPVVVTVRGKIEALSRRTIRRLQIRAMLRGVDAIIAVSRSLARRVHAVAGSDVGVQVIPNGVDATVFAPCDRAAARAALGWCESARYLLAVGHLQRVKGFDRAVAALPAVRAALGDVRLILAGSTRGEPGFKRRLRRLMVACGGPPAVSFAGPVPTGRLRLMYAAADVLVCPSRSEGWCNAVAEALACGTPVVATAVGGNPEQLDDPILGTLVENDDPETLAGAMVDALRRAWDRPSIAARGAARDWGRVADEVYGVFRRVLADRGVRRLAAACSAGPGMGACTRAGATGMEAGA